MYWMGCFSLKHRVFSRYLIKLSGIAFTFRKDPRLSDWYLEIPHPGPSNSCSVINLESTACHYGGRRYWFACPSCLRSAGVLYADGDNFRCRKCLDLVYLSQKLNYRSFVPALRKIRKAWIENREWDTRWHIYRGQPTKRALRQQKKDKWARSFNEMTAGWL